jgi:hypothetical protein
VQHLPARLLAAHRHRRDDHDDRLRHSDGAGPEQLGHRTRHPGHVLQPQPQHRVRQHAYSLAAYAGQPITLKFTGSEDFTKQTSFVIDDTAINTG